MSIYNKNFACPIRLRAKDFMLDVRRLETGDCCKTLSELLDEIKFIGVLIDDLPLSYARNRFDLKFYLKNAWQRTTNKRLKSAIFYVYQELDFIQKTIPKSNLTSAIKRPIV